MTIYAIRQDNYRYREIDLRVDDFIDAFPEKYSLLECQKFSAHNIELSDFWPRMQTEFNSFEDRENLLPDITPWIFATLVLSPKAYRLLEDTMKLFGEFLPILIGEETYYIFNCLTIAEADETVSISNEKLVFKPGETEGKILFKSPFQACLDTYSSERFKEIVEAFELKGIIFDTNLATPF